MYFRSRDSMYLGTNFPRMTKRWLPSIEPSVPNSAIMNWNRWSGLRRMVLQISEKLTHSVFFVPTGRRLDRNKTRNGSRSRHRVVSRRRTLVTGGKSRAGRVVGYIITTAQSQQHGHAVIPTMHNQYFMYVIYTEKKGRDEKRVVLIGES